MNRFDIAKIRQGFQPATQRDGCRHCMHVRMDMDPRTYLHAWQCTKGDFFTSALAICQNFERVVPPAITEVAA